MKEFRNVDEYIAAAAPVAQPILQRLRQTLRTLLPQAQEKIWYGVPFYHQEGEVAGFAAYQHHVSLGIGPKALTAPLRQKLQKSGYQTGQGTLQIRFDQEIPHAEIRSLIRLKLKLNLARKK